MLIATVDLGRTVPPTRATSGSFASNNTQNMRMVPHPESDLAGRSRLSGARFRHGPHLWITLLVVPMLFAGSEFPVKHIRLTGQGGLPTV